MKSDTDKISTFKDLIVWQKAHRLVLVIYRETRRFPREEVYGLTSQMRRSAVSASSNIAEGFSRQSYKDKAHFYCMAQGSITELQNLVLIAKDVEYIPLKLFDELEKQLIVTHKLLNGIIKKSKSIHNS